MFYQIARGVREIHSLGIMHRDLKPENFFLGENKVVKLGDFGESKQQDKINVTGQHTGKVGTEMYMSPEMLKHKG